LKEGEGLAQRAEGAPDAGFAVDFGRGEFGFEEGAHGPCDVLRDPEHLLRNVLVLLQRLQRLSERLASLPRLGGR
jgi:hypothetical protein